MATTEREYEEIVRKISEEAFSNGNLAVIDEYFAEDFVGHAAAAPEEIHGPEEYKEFIATYRDAFPDLNSTTADLIAEGDKVVERHVATGTHEGELMGIAPTGAEAEVEGITIVRFEDGKIVESWDIADVMGMMQQLGVVDAPGP